MCCAWGWPQWLDARIHKYTCIHAYVQQLQLSTQGTQLHRYTQLQIQIHLHSCRYCSQLQLLSAICNCGNYKHKLMCTWAYGKYTHTCTDATIKYHYILGKNDFHRAAAARKENSLSLSVWAANFIFNSWQNAIDFSIKQINARPAKFINCN